LKFYCPALVRNSYGVPNLQGDLLLVHLNYFGVELYSKGYLVVLIEYPLHVPKDERSLTNSALSYDYYFEASLGEETESHRGTHLGHKVLYISSESYSYTIISSKSSLHK
jgi:hypothetical protein